MSTSIKNCKYITIVTYNVSLSSPYCSSSPSTPSLYCKHIIACLLYYSIEFENKILALHGCQHCISREAIEEQMINLDNVIITESIEYNNGNYNPMVKEIKLIKDYFEDIEVVKEVSMESTFTNESTNESTGQ